MSSSKPVRPLAKRPSASTRHVAGTLVMALLLFWAALQSGFSPNKLFIPDGLSTAWEVAAGFTQPDLSWSFMRRVTHLLIESLAIASLGLLLAIALAIPLAVAAAENPVLPHGPNHPLRRAIRLSVRWLTRALLSFLRGIPEIVWAFIFVRIFGLGPGPAVLAIGLTFGGIIGKLYAEQLEACDPRPASALAATGCGRLGLLAYGLLPQVRADWLSYGLFRFECALRSAAVLGIVGAGGIGTEIMLSIRYFQFDKLATALIGLWLLIALFEWLSTVLRSIPSMCTIGLLLGAAVLSAARLDIPWADLVSHGGSEMRTFMASLASPNTDFAFVSRAWNLALETVAMALFATASAALTAYALVPFATRRLTVGSFLPAPPTEQNLRGLLRPMAFALLRACFQIFRGLPELVWALFFVLWVGPGPFAGTLAIAAHTVGILGRLYAECCEDATPQVPAYLQASGATRLAQWLYGIVPQRKAQLLGLTLFRFEVNLRATAMVGFVAAGGLGNAIDTAIKLFHFGDLATLLLILMAVIILVDSLGDAARRRLLP